MRSFTRSALTVAALTFTATAAEAATTDANSSRGSADLSWSTRKTIVGPSSDKLGGGTISVQFSANLDPVKDTTKPLVSVDMKGVVLQASWSDDKTIDLTPAPSTSQDGKVHVEHTLAPHVTVFLDLPIFGKLQYDYNAESLIGDLPGSSFNYDGIGDGTFAPWATTNYGIAKVKAPALADAVLVSKPIEQLIGLDPSNPALTGTLAFNATTEPTFNYQTTEITVDNGQPINQTRDHWSIPTVDTDFIDVPTMVKGQITYTGSLFGRPSITITSVGGFSLSKLGLNGITFEVDQLGVELPYSSTSNGNTPIAVEFPAQMIHIPLPNVKAKNTLDIGSANVGDHVSKQSEIKNTGELGAQLSIKSSDPQFKVSAQAKLMNAKESFQLDIEFDPANEGPQSADITVTSNDPNEPVQTIHVTGNGTKVTEPPAADVEPETNFGKRDDSGCGCRTTPTPSGYAGYGVFGLALAAMLRRRRR